MRAVPLSSRLRVCTVTPFFQALAAPLSSQPNGPASLHPPPSPGLIDLLGARGRVARQADFCPGPQGSRPYEHPAVWKPRARPRTHITLRAAVHSIPRVQSASSAGCRTLCSATSQACHVVSA